MKLDVKEPYLMDEESLSLRDQAMRMRCTSQVQVPATAKNQTGDICSTDYSLAGGRWDSLS